MTDYIVLVVIAVIIYLSYRKNKEKIAGADVLGNLFRVFRSLLFPVSPEFLKFTLRVRQIRKRLSTSSTQNLRMVI